MKKMNLLLVLALLAWTWGIFAQADVKETVAMIKTNLVQSNKRLNSIHGLKPQRFI